MPTGTPRIGNNRPEENALPRPEVLGTLNINESRSDTPSIWTREDGTVIELTEPAPPWEQVDDKFTASDARRFVECPPNWKLHWINPRLLDSEGWRDWQAVLATDPRVNVRVKTMVTVENYIRRGGPTGDILAWMWQGWYESVKKKMRLKTDAQTQSAMDKQASLKEEFARGTYGPYLRVEGTKHPTHTIADGKALQD